jgi:hypothetical protein
LTPGTTSCADAMPVIARTPATPVTADPTSRNPRREIWLLLLLSLSVLLPLFFMFKDVPSLDLFQLNHCNFPSTRPGRQLTIRLIASRGNLAIAIRPFRWRVNKLKSNVDTASMGGHRKNLSGPDHRKSDCLRMRVWNRNCTADNGPPSPLCDEKVCNAKIYRLTSFV